MKNITSHQYYRGLNRRFDKRVFELIRLGARFKDGVWANPRGLKASTVANATIMHADRRHWRDAVLPLFR